MKITYDRTADAVYIRLRSHPGESHLVRVSEDLAVDLDREDRPLGIEILGASGFFDRPGHPEIRLEHLRASESTDEEEPAGE